MQIELAVQMGELVTNRMMQYTQLPGNLLVTHAGCEAPCHNKFSGRQNFHRIHWPDATQMACLLSDQRDFNLRAAIRFTG